jgi:multiple sugar transport system permease protein
VATVETVEQPGTLRNARVREAVVGYGFVALPLAVFGIFFLYPIGYALYISFFDWGVLGKIDSVGTDNYRLLADDELFRKGLKNIAYYTAVVVPAQSALALFLAIIVNRGLRGRAFFRASYYFPSLASSAAITAIAIYILNAHGLLNSILGIDHPWFGDSDTALESIMGLNIWTTSGTMMLFYLAGLQAIPTDVYEAAAIDGAKPWRTFWRITFPLLKPGHFFVATLSLIGCLKLFDQSYIVSGGTGGPNYATLTPVLYLYQTAIQDVDFGYASAIGIALFAVIFVATLIQWLLFGRSEAS